MLLYTLARNIQPRVVVETGTCLGVSTIWIAAALRANGRGRIHTVDNYSTHLDSERAAAVLYHRRPDSVVERIARAGLTQFVDVRVGDSVPELERLRREIPPDKGVHLAFIDADHSIKGALGDFLAAEPLLAVGGYVILHDIFPDVCNCDGPAAVCQRINEVGVGKYELCSLYTAQTNYGLAIARRIA